MEDRIFEKCLEKWKNSDSHTPFWGELAEELSYPSGESLRSDFKNERRKRHVPSKMVTDDGIHYKTVEEYDERTGYITSDKLIEICQADSKNPTSVMIAHGFDPEKWDIVSYKNNMWHSQRPKDMGLNIMYQSKIVVKPKKQEWSEDNVKKIFDSLEKKDFKKLVYKADYVFNGKVLFIPFADLHYGMMATEKVTGNTYNMTVAEDLVEKAISQILQRVKGQKYEKVLLLLGNDFLNCDNIFGTTTAGTQQDNDSSWFDMMDGAAELVIRMVQAFLPIAPVEVYSINSNHDTHSYYGLSKAVEFYFKDDENVTFENSPIARKYFSFGKNLVALSHDLPVKRALEIITTEAKDKWSDATHMYCILAHLHSAMNYEKQGYLEIYRLPTISGWSRWTNEKGYQQTEKRTQCFVFDKENGITDIMNIVVS